VSASTSIREAGDVDGVPGSPHFPGVSISCYNCTMSNSERLRVEIQGAVQGVGFRPFVYRLATELKLNGWVINDTNGVFVEVEGPKEILEQFLQRLPAERPPLSIIQSIHSTWLAAAGYDRFEIRQSADQGPRTVLVLPDVATCPDCLREVLDPDDRRHQYPFTNCTNCGPRFTIIEALPYDRPNTSMRRFTMCPACRREYEDPLDRRFHAQPNACPICGPRLALYDCGLQTPALEPERPGSREPERAPRSRDSAGASVADCGLRTQSAIAEGDAALRLAASALRTGQILAVKGLGGFLLMVDARNGEALSRLRERKPRHAKPFAVMARDLEQARTLGKVPDEAEALLSSPEAPILLLQRRPDAPISDQVAPGNPNLGIMLPYTPLHHLLLREVDFPLVATSGNLTDEPICTDEDEAMVRLGGIAEAFLVHDRPIVRHVDDSVAWILDGRPRLLRRARGYAPLPVTLADPTPTLLAVGAHLKNSVALSVGRQVFISQHIGDLETPEAMTAFERVIASFLRLYEAAPVAVAHDLHPDYLSTKWAKGGGRFDMDDGRSAPDDYTSSIRNRQSATPALAPERSAGAGIRNLIGVQHHHAHLASCLAENGAEGPALGITWDGTGYGADGTIWGGEFLLGDAAQFTRVAHLRQFHLPGGDAAVHEPRRVALALLWEIFGEDALEMDDLAPVRALAPSERKVIAQMLRTGLNSPVTTSAGRLFDGVAAMLDLHQQVSFEGQAAMALEFTADEAEGGAYPLLTTGQYTSAPRSGSAATESEGLAAELPLVVDWAPLLEGIVADLRRGVAARIIAARFHNSLVDGIMAVAKRVGHSRVALSGGCFQNRFLTEHTVGRLRFAGFEVLLHRQVPPNDGGISLGQIAVAAAMLKADRNSER
jgi:hydrogenase maturation protein HypF